MPIIEPVKESFSSLIRTVQGMVDVGGETVVIVNPDRGDHAGGAQGIEGLLRTEFAGRPEVIAGILLKEAVTVEAALSLFDRQTTGQVALIHAGFTDAKKLAEALGRRQPAAHVFLEPSCGKLYRKHFVANRRVLVRDGFEKRRNRDHPELEDFSDLHVTFPEEGMTGFGDFLIVGSEYSEAGGPAYAVAIHLTFIDPDKDDAMYVYHFVSESQDTPQDPAGKFREALDAMMEKISVPGSHVFESSAVREFRVLHAKGHFPGLGYIKKLSMKHHIETLAAFFEQE